MPAAVVVDVSWVNGLAAIRSLGRAGAPVVAIDHRRSALGFRSRYGIAVSCPDPGLDEQGFVALLVEIGDALGRPAPIFPTHDEQVNVIARNRTVLGGRFSTPFRHGKSFGVSSRSGSSSSEPRRPACSYPGRGTLPPRVRRSPPAKSSAIWCPRNHPTRQASSGGFRGRRSGARPVPSSIARTPTPSRTRRWCRSCTRW